MSTPERRKFLILCPTMLSDTGLRNEKAHTHSPHSPSRIMPPLTPGDLVASYHPYVQEAVSLSPRLTGTLQPGTFMALDPDGLVPWTAGRECVGVLYTFVPDASQMRGNQVVIITEGTLIAANCHPQVVNPAVVLNLGPRTQLTFI